VGAWDVFACAGDSGAVEGDAVGVVWGAVGEGVSAQVFRGEGKKSERLERSEPNLLLHKRHYTRRQREATHTPRNQAWQFSTPCVEEPAGGVRCEFGWD
jgi:hypothetical protein